MNNQRDYSDSEYTKTIGIKPKRLEYIRKIKGKKSLAGMLDLIIEKYELSENNNKK